MTGRVVVIGDALIDELRDDTGVREFVGGAALNVAVGLSRLGVPTSLIAMVGDDEAGEQIRSYLAEYDVRPAAERLRARVLSRREHAFGRGRARVRLQRGRAEPPCALRRRRARRRSPRRPWSW